VSLGARAVGWPSDEVDAINSARIAGKTDEEIRALVAKLEADRKVGKLGIMKMNSLSTVFSPDLVQTGKTDETDLVNNEAFLVEVFGLDLAEARPLVVSFKGNPASLHRNAWFGRPWIGSSNMATELPADANNYFSLAVFRPDESGQYRRQKARFQALHAVMLDDVGSKVAMERLTLPPSWLLETSPRICQAGYLLCGPLNDGLVADRLMNTIVTAGLCDPGANGPRARLARLPVAINSKHSPAFRCRMQVWSPGLRYSVEEMVDGLQLEMTQAGRPKRQGRRQTQEHPTIFCPWITEHTSQVDGGTAYFEPR
jgi:hypothetical protein